jgi:hypothetical protein
VLAATALAAGRPLAVRKGLSGALEVTLTLRSRNARGGRDEPPHRITIKLNGHDPYAYLKDVLTRLPTQPASRIEELLPHRWQPARAS